MTLAVTHMIQFEDGADNAPFSGTENHVIDLLKGLVQTGLDVELVALIKRDTYRLETLFLEMGRANIKVTPVLIQDDDGFWKNLGRFHQLCSARRDRIIHTHLPLASTYGRLAAALSGCVGIVETQHNDNPSDAEGLQQIKWLFLDWLTHATIAISDSVRNFWVNNVGINDKKISVIHYGIAPPDVLLPRENARNDLDIAQDAFCVGFVGKLSRQKNIPLLFEAIGTMDGVTLCLIGSGEDEEFLKRSAQTMGLKEVVFAGPRGSAADYMVAFDMMVLPSRWEGLGLVLLEAMIRRVPVAGSKNGAIPETLGYGKRGFLFDTAAELRQIIQKIKNDPMVAKDKEMTAYQDVLSEYTIQAMVDKTRRLYYKIASMPML